MSHILLIEDNLVAARLTEIIIKQAGCQFSFAMSGEQALELLQTTLFDLILTEVNLPGISVEQMILVIREREKELYHTPIPIIGLTVDILEQTESDYLNVGLAQLIRKPLHLQRMQEIIRQYILPTVDGMEEVKKLVTGRLGHDLPDTEEQLFALNNFPLLDSNSGIRILGDAKVFEELLKVMVDEAIPDDKKAIEEAHAVEDWSLIEELAHKMKSGALYCGTIKMLYACQYLERYRKAGHAQSLEKLYKQLLEVLSDTTYEIKRWLNSH
ncbi:response regulator [Legionella tunisiensis]|uniref:response regulator n=1 Tax=Legionella tunisiensis TaxID=1034944 RepID=UPI000304B412|nr:response regulator [Legionella tunisiensis]